MAEHIHLFNSESIGDISLSHFTIEDQVTVVGFGLAAGETVTFEMGIFSAPPRPDVCNPCEMPAVVMPEPTFYQALKCCNGSNVTLSASNPVVVLDAPVDIRIRARLNGFVFGAAAPTVDVRAYATRTALIRTAQSGCGCAA
jgi:hypothetical protein